MKVLFGVIFFIAIFWGIITYSKNIPLHKTVPTPTPAMTQVTFPIANDILSPGKTYTLKWQGGGKSPISIFLINKDAQKQGVSVSLFDRIYSIPNTGYYNYTVPQNMPNGLYKFEIGDLSSNYFEISN